EPLPGPYSIAMYQVSLNLPRSNVCARFACVSAEVIFASSTNIRMKSSSSATEGRMRLIATSFSKPSGPVALALNTSAMPPTLMRSRSTYLPNGVARSRNGLQTRDPRAHGRGGMEPRGSAARQEAPSQRRQHPDDEPGADHPGLELEEALRLEGEVRKARAREPVEARGCGARERHAEQAAAEPDRRRLDQEQRLH